MTGFREQRMAAMRLHRCTNAYFVARKHYEATMREEQRGQRSSPEEQAAWDRTVAGSVRRLETAVKNLDAACSAWKRCRTEDTTTNGAASGTLGDMSGSPGAVGRGSTKRPAPGQKDT